MHVWNTPTHPFLGYAHNFDPNQKATVDFNPSTNMHFVQRPTYLIHPFLLAAPSAEYVIPVLAPEKASATASASDAKDKGKVEPSHPTVARQNNAIRHGSNVNVIEEAESWIICMALPGVKSNDVTIEEKAGNMKVEATRKNGIRYEQHFSLDPKRADLSKMGAELSDGVLTLIVPKKAVKGPVSVPVLAKEAPDIDDTKYHFALDIPGVKSSNLKLEFKENEDMLLVVAERKCAGGRSAKVERAISVPASVDMARAKAYLIDGVLTLVAPRLKSESLAESHTIKVGSMKPVVETIEEGL